MKKLFLSAAGLFIFSLLASAQTTSEDWNTNGNQKIYSAMETGDFNGVKDLLADDIVDHSPGGDVHGADSAVAMMQDMHDHINDLHFEPIANASDGDYSFALVKITGTTKDDFMGMPGNTSIEWNSIELVKVLNGKAVEHWSYMSPQDVQQMMHMSMMNGHTMNMDHKMHREMKSMNQ
jgi:predicted ester cyclase